MQPYSIPTNSIPQPRSRTDPEPLARPRLEIFPAEGIAERVALLRDSRIAITCSPRKGIETTLDLAEHLTSFGLDVAPHVSARLVEDHAHGRRIGARLVELGVKDIFVIGGDARRPAGPFTSAASLLAFFAECGFTFADVGVASYPEGHPTVDDSTLWSELQHKQRWATYTVTQLCFDATTIARWIDKARGEGISLPVYVGVAGAVERMKLMRLALRIGVGDSTRFVSKNKNVVAGLLGGKLYTPSPLVTELSRGGTTVAGYHIYTFNQIETTEEWLSDRLEGA